MAGSLVKTSYTRDDVELLLKDLTGTIKEMSASERETLVQSGVHYSETLPKEDEPTAEYMTLYKEAVSRNKNKVAKHVKVLGNRIMEEVYERRERDKRGDSCKPIIISLVRAGVPVGVLLKRYIRSEYDIDCSHYGISIIKDKGIDINAMEYIYSKEIEEGHNDIDNIYFIDGWTGKGMIKSQLDEAIETLKEYDEEHWGKLENKLFVLADPAQVATYSGTYEDYLLPSACLNSIISGLTSRTILNSSIGEEDFHGAIYFERFEKIDKTMEYVDVIEEEMYRIGSIVKEEENREEGGREVVERIKRKYGIEDIARVKPGIGETTRVLLRRDPWAVLINSNISGESRADIKHIIELCNKKGIQIIEDDIGNYVVCGIVKNKEKQKTDKESRETHERSDNNKR